MDKLANRDFSEAATGGATRDGTQIYALLEKPVSAWTERDGETVRRSIAFRDPRDPDHGRAVALIRRFRDRRREADAARP